MSTFLFNNTVFGPVKSRRLGVSLGINLLPNDSKLCSFDCIYCECGWNPDYRKIKSKLPERVEVKELLENKLKEMNQKGELPDVITFAGNGEPTLHPEFAEIIDDTIELRNAYALKARIAVLSNSTMLHKAKVVEALKKVDDNILKLDSAIISTIETMNIPGKNFNFDSMIDHLIRFEGKLTIQTMFLKGSYNGKSFDNTSDNEVFAWIELLKKIKPQKVMIYTIARDTPLATLQKTSLKELNSIAKIVKDQLSIEVIVSG
ncbi:MAG: radical SAM protein [Prolixibacteraceae bacterium]|nr:radical SAM protein [Prolixibacteraceae bacterium]